MVLVSLGYLGSYLKGLYITSIFVRVQEMVLVSGGYWWSYTKGLNITGILVYRTWSRLVEATQVNVEKETILQVYLTSQIYCSASLL